ncbi:MAG: hypothetical protein LBT98_01520 [Puniceicoccales bacterium]|nr:hypothetical protein [Puniceicoccales bacterium]
MNTNHIRGPTLVAARPGRAIQFIATNLAVVGAVLTGSLLLAAAVTCAWPILIGCACAVAIATAAAVIICHVHFKNRVPPADSAQIPIEGELKLGKPSDVVPEAMDPPAVLDGGACARLFRKMQPNMRVDYALQALAGEANISLAENDVAEIIALIEKVVGIKCLARKNANSLGDLHLADGNCIGAVIDTSCNLSPQAVPILAATLSLISNSKIIVKDYDCSASMHKLSIWQILPGSNYNGIPRGKGLHLICNYSNSQFTSAECMEYAREWGIDPGNILITHYNGIKFAVDELTSADPSEKAN